MSYVHVEYPKWVYKKGHEPKIIKSEEEESEDWSKSPHGFIDYGKAGVDMADPLKVQLAGEATQDIVDIANDTLKLNQMDKDQLEEFAKEKLGINIDKRKNNKKIVHQIKKALKG